jgi:asparagine synthase (glutamine-hydrolysing)
VCGISLVLDHRGEGESVLTALARMHAELAHRGPDGEGWLVVAPDLQATRLPTRPTAPPGTLRLATAFRRLAIQDLSAAASQPLSSHDGRHWIVHNGEIYNHRALRETLCGHGHQFRTGSDTEVALAAYREWGTDCFARFDGMWALLIVDLDRGRLVGSRDRLGIKPLFYSMERNRLSFASEPRALAVARQDGPRVEPRRFTEFLSGLPPQSPALSFFEGIHPVPAGSTFEIDLRQVGVQPPVFRRFWDLAEYHADGFTAPAYGDAVEELRDLLGAAVDSHRGAAVPVGCLLSGGLDTSVVATMLASRQHEPLQTYSIVYDDPEMSEWPYVQAVAAQARLDSHTHRLTPAEAWDSVDAVVRAQGQPLLGQELIAQYRAYRMAREHGRIVVLEGQGADELLAGMPGYEAAFLHELFRTLRWRDLVTEVRCRARRYHESPLHVVRRYFGPWLRRSRAGRSYPWLLPSAAPVDAEPGWETDRASDPSLLNQYLYRLVKRTNLPAVLLHQDRGSMAHGVESRVPFLDHRFVEFCFRLPADYKVRYGLRKRILLDAARPLLPALVLNRTDKKTFVSKQGWLPLRRDHADALREMARSRALVESPHIRRAALVPFVEDYLRGRHDDELAVWRLYTASRWLDAFGLN